LTNARVVFHLVAQGASDSFLVGHQRLQHLDMNMAQVQRPDLAAFLLLPTLASQKVPFSHQIDIVAFAGHGQHDQSMQPVHSSTL